MKHFYVFYRTSNGDNVYERTCGTKDRAEEKLGCLTVYTEDGQPNV